MENDGVRTDYWFGIYIFGVYSCGSLVVKTSAEILWTKMLPRLRQVLAVKALIERWLGGCWLSSYDKLIWWFEYLENTMQLLKKPMLQIRNRTPFPHEFMWVWTPAVTQGAGAWSLYVELMVQCKPNTDPTRGTFPSANLHQFLNNVYYQLFALGLPSSPCWVCVRSKGQVA